MKNNTPFNKKINNYHELRWKHIHQYIKDYAKKEGDATIYNLRVEIKKIIALAHYLEFSNSEFNSEKSLLPIIKIFKLLGNQRDFFRAKKYCNKFHFKKSIVQNKFSTSSFFFNKLKAHPKKYQNHCDAVKNKIKENFSYTSSTGLKKYLRACNKEIKSSHSILKKRLHFIRKKIKDVFYLVELANSNTTLFISPSREQTQNALQNLIGKWHDIDKFYSMLKKMPNIKISEEKFLEIKKEERRLISKIKVLFAMYR